MLIYIIRDIHISNNQSNIWDMVLHHYNNDSGKISNDFKRFHDRLITKYPCITEDDESVWGDGPLIGNFGDKITCLNLSIGFSNEEQKRLSDALIYIMTLATEFNFDVYLEGRNKIIRPEIPKSELKKIKMKSLILIFIIAILYFISKYMSDFENGNPIEAPKGNNGWFFLLLMGIAKFLNVYVNYETFKFLIISIIIISILWLAYDVYNYYVLKRKWKSITD